MYIKTLHLNQFKTIFQSIATSNYPSTPRIYLHSFYFSMMMNVFKPEYLHQTSDNVWQKNELCPTKTDTVFRREVNFLIGYGRLKTQKHSVT